MAISIQAYPATYSSVQGDLIYTVAETVKTADPTTYPNYKFIADVYVGATMVARLRKVPNPVTKIGIFNVGQVVRNYIATTFNPAAATLSAQILGDGEFWVDVTVKFGEEYSYTTYTNLTVDSSRKFFNNYNTRINESSITDLINEPLTSRPYVTSVMHDVAFNFVPFLPSTTADFTLRIKTYDYSDTLVQGLNFAITPTVAYQLHIINLSKDAINAVEPGMINDSIKYFTCEFDGAGTDTTYRFDLVCNPIYEAFNIHFLNKYGGFESKVFDKVSRKTINIEKKDFGRLPYTVNSSGEVSYKSSNNVYNESRSVYASQYKERMTLNSDLLTDAEYTWLQELVVSPMVYLEEDGNFYPCVITENNYEPKKVINDELTNLTINIEFGVQLNGQFR